MTFMTYSSAINNVHGLIERFQFEKLKIEIHLWIRSTQSTGENVKCFLVNYSFYLSKYSSLWKHLEFRS